jgi:hypothetical protein
MISCGFRKLKMTASYPIQYDHETAIILKDANPKRKANGDRKVHKPITHATNFMLGGCVFICSLLCILSDVRYLFQKNATTIRIIDAPTISNGVSLDGVDLGGMIVKSQEEEKGPTFVPLTARTRQNHRPKYKSKLGVNVLVSIPSTTINDVVEKLPSLSS